ncbi:MAG: hypothetical protein ABJA77_08180 [Variovorax sp.]
MGDLKASRILDWLQANEDVLGLRVGRHVAQPRCQLAPATLAAVVPAATAIVPYEKFVLPAALEYRKADGSTATDWMLHVVGKGGRTRQVPVPAELVDAFSDELARHVSSGKWAR